MEREKKRVLVMIDWFDPAYKAGGPIRSCVNFINHFHNEFELFVLTGNTDLDSDQPLAGIESNCWSNYKNKASIMYLPVAELSKTKLLSIINETNPDYLYLNSLYSKKFTLLPLWLKTTGRIQTKMVLAPRGMLKSSALAFKSTKKNFFLRLMRMSGVPRTIRFQATDEQEYNDIIKHFREADVVLAPNLPGAIDKAPVSLQKRSGELKMIFVGRIHPIKNLHYLLRLLREVKGKLSLSVIGVTENASYWQECLAIINSLPGSVEVNYLGELSHEKILEQVKEHHLLGLPTLGENFGHAIFESLSSGRPVLISDQTPWRCLENQKAGWDISLSSPDLFLSSLNQALQWNQQEFEEWASGALGAAKKFLEQSSAKENYLKLFN
jgi:glycosyltransferase involved in cell wall biosynthesis